MNDINLVIDLSGVSDYSDDFLIEAFGRLSNTFHSLRNLKFVSEDDNFLPGRIIKIIDECYVERNDPYMR